MPNINKHAMMPAEPVLESKEPHSKEFLDHVRKNYKQRTAKLLSAASNTDDYATRLQKQVQLQQMQLQAQNIQLLRQQSRAAAAMLRVPPPLIQQDNPNFMLNQPNPEKLLTCSKVPLYIAAAVCPCVFMHNILSMMMLKSHKNRSENELMSCYTTFASCFLDLPCLFCMNQFSNRALDTIANNIPNKSHDEEPGLIDTLLKMGHFGPFKSTATWENDGEGWLVSFLCVCICFCVFQSMYNTPPCFDTHAHATCHRDLNDQSEDWWPVSWCCYYCGTGCSECLTCNVGGNAPRVPFCFACLVAAVYPICVAPLTCVLRSMAVEQMHSNEWLVETCAKSVCCMPCTLVLLFFSSSFFKKKNVESAFFLFRFKHMIN